MEVEALHAFGVRLLKLWREQHPEENVVFSPLSLAGAFALLFPGARGVTRTELDAVFGFEVLSCCFFNRTDIFFLQSKNVSQLLGGGEISQLGEGSLVEWANRIYVDLSIALEEDYVSSVGAELVERVDFARDTTASLARINDWVSQKTRGCIPTVLDQLKKDTALVAVNALYFKGRWEHQFPPRSTRDDVFHGVGGPETVRFMQLNGTRLPYLKCPDHDGVLFGLPYENSQLSMIIFLPNSPDGWKQVEEVMPAYCNEALKKGWLQTVKVDSLRMPKWELDFNFDKLPHLLADLGLRTAFSPNESDFGNITKDPRGVFVSDVVHKCKIIVNEEVST